ncbi:unnamed protein product [Schistocephalus solidus]|uniref:6-phosphogluconolactonase n=1 Tax=Schistocephalus solidus TaxID=70667 RepID=A0A183SZD9_SCHSO|nr:unnamed protein product [Schistocephalus solidus]
MLVLNLLNCLKSLTDPVVTLAGEALTEDEKHVTVLSIPLTFHLAGSNCQVPGSAFKRPVCVSGGSMPTQISPGLLALKDVDWRRVHFFFCDERVVPFNSPESTYGVYKALLFDRLPDLPVENVHKISVEGTAAEAAAKYQSDIMIFFGTDQGYPAFDLLLLGLGPDGHTCSLFPNHELLSTEDLVVAPITDSPKPPPNRVTLTLPVINKSKHVAFLVTGQSKAEVVAVGFTPFSCLICRCLTKLSM